MPVHLRIFSLRTLAKFKEKEAAASNSGGRGGDGVMGATEEGMKNKKLLRGISKVGR